LALLARSISAAYDREGFFVFYRSDSLVVRCSFYAGGFGTDDTDIAVFRFTLGIPGFDDALIPRAVGVLGGIGLILNHLFGTSTPSAAQVLHTRWMPQTKEQDCCLIVLVQSTRSSRPARHTVLSLRRSAWHVHTGMATAYKPTADGRAFPPPPHPGGFLRTLTG
jgi:hypothetical protein